MHCPDRLDCFCSFREVEAVAVEVEEEEEAQEEAPRLQPLSALAEPMFALRLLLVSYLHM